MSTTELYVEYIVIGLESLIWIFISFYIIIGNRTISFLKYCVSNLFSSFVLLGVCYILGLVTDRLSDLIFEKRKIKIKSQYHIKSKTSLAVWGKYNQDNFATFTLSRIRIVRSTILNSSIIAVLLTYLIYKHHFNMALMVFTFFLFAGISICSNFAHKHLLDNYYKKTSALEEITSDHTAHKKGKKDKKSKRSKRSKKSKKST